MFDLVSSYQPAGDQPQAIVKLDGRRSACIAGADGIIFKRYETASAQAEEA